VDVLPSRFVVAVLAVMRREGFIWDVAVAEVGGRAGLRVHLKYGPNGELVINDLRRVSRGGRRVYCGVHDIGSVRTGTGVTILSTPEGVFSGREAKSKGVGGEVVALIW